MQHLGSKCHINDYVTPRYYDIILVSQRCHIKEVRLYGAIVTCSCACKELSQQ
jgi:hypothetical protein